MKRPFAAYQGNEPYVFVCYAHEDAEQVYPEIQRLHEGGARIWYDEGVSPGTRWTDELANKLTEASVVLFFCTPQSVKRKHCQNELNFAIDKDRPLLVIQDGEVDLPPGMQLQLGSHQSILKHDLSAEQFEAKLTAAINQYVVSGTLSTLAAPKPARSRTRRPLAYVAVVAAAVVLTALLWRTWPSPTSESGAVARPSVSTNVEYTVAVLPFRALSSEPATVTFAHGLTDELVNVLSGPMPARFDTCFRRYFTSSASSRQGRHCDTATPPKIWRISANRSDAGYLVEGSVRSAGEHVRVTVQLVHAADNEPSGRIATTCPQRTRCRRSATLRVMPRDVSRGWSPTCIGIPRRNLLLPLRTKSGTERTASRWTR